MTTMPKLKNVGVREFRDHATMYLSGSDPVAVSKHGQVIGFYIPVEADREQARRALEQLGRSVEEILAETGMTEEELSELFDLRRALPG
ncbi:prevent-host-death family protein [mine drainage metagenome]|uniref:Prevent-host-death family protein n=1 Tax=mine drainage metagenome TaxID=410659 RepID=T1A2R8_9ZZZZ